MKKILLILFVSVFYTTISNAGGDDRDQILPLNTSQENSVDEKSFLQEINDEKLDQPSDSNTANLKQILEEIEQDLSNLSNEEKNNQNVQNFKENYIDSYSGRFILIGVLALIFVLILIYSTFLSRK
jgi:TolA-binding protein